MNPYEILGVPKDADDATIHRAYRKASSAAHPDKGGDDRQMALVNMANDVLSDAARRKRYDETGETQERPPLEVEAQSALMQLFNDMMEKAPEDTPLAEMARGDQGAPEEAGCRDRGPRQQAPAVARAAEEGGQEGRQGR
jgi:curved DNA-binding protein CbpA